MSSAADIYSEHLRSVRERLIRASIDDPALVVFTSGLARVEEILRKPLRIVILGEYNSGKTSVADLLIGDGLLPTSVVSNTSVPVLISYAPSPALYGIDQNETRIRIDSDTDSEDALTDLAYSAIQIALPLDRLRNYQILDTPSSVNPGTFVADADIVIWCTVATRAWTESERIAWSNLPKRCMRNAILVATHRDSLRTTEDCESVEQRLRQQTGDMFRGLVLVSAGASDHAPRGDATRAGELRDTVSVVANRILERKAQKAGKIVRRLSRLTFHEFAKREVRPEAVSLLSSWELHSGSLLEHLAKGNKSVDDTIKDLLTSYALFAERLRPGVVTGESELPATKGVISASMSLPMNGPAATRRVLMLASDLTGLLRMLAGTSIYLHPDTRLQYQAARSLLLSLADLDGDFDALGRMLHT